MNPRGRFLAAVLTAVLTACSAQEYRHFSLSTPIPRDHVLILGFQGGRDKWNDPGPGVARFAKRIASWKRSEVHIEIVENRKREIAVMLVRNALDTNRDGRLDEIEKGKARIILYGMSFGGAAVVKMARQLKEMNVPVLLTVQVDSVGRHDHVIPSNVRYAANLYQKSGKIIRGEAPIKAEDPSRTAILGNFEFSYKRSSIDISDVAWYKKIFRLAHTKMDRDPAVWNKVEELIWQVLRDRIDH